MHLLAYQLHGLTYNNVLLLIGQNYLYLLAFHGTESLEHPGRQFDISFAQTLAELDNVARDILRLFGWSEIQILY